jgi:hypothetical protein
MVDKCPWSELRCIWAIITFGRTGIKGTERNREKGIHEMNRVTGE